MAINEARGTERRTSLVLLQYWNDLRGERAFPTEDEIDPARLSIIWDHCFLIQIRDIEQVHYYNYSYLGTDIVSAYDLGLLYPDNGRMITPEANRSANLFKHVINTQDPLLDEGQYVNKSDSLVKFRQAILPLGSDGKVVSILGGAWFKVFS